MNRVNWKLATLKEKQKLYSQLLEELSPNKRQLFDTKIKTRTRHFSLALEDMMKSQNASALMRTADAFGIHRIDIYDKNERFNVSAGISKGVEKWLDSNFFNSYDDGGVAEWVSRLKATGRKLYVTTLDKNAVPLSQIDSTVPATICFGNEQEGASAELISLADKTVYTNERLCRKL